MLLSMKTTFLGATRAIFYKDLQAELRGRDLIGAMSLFALLAVLVFSFALELDRIARAESISGVLWVTIIFASILGLNRSMAQERDQGNFDALLIAPIDRAALFAGKLAGNFVFVTVVALVIVPLMTIIYNITLINGWVLVTLVLGTFGVTVIGTLLSAMTVQTRGREALLPIVMLPITLPLLLAAVRATTSILQGAEPDTWLFWIGLLAALDVIFLTMSVLLFGYVVEE